VPRDASTATKFGSNIAAGGCAGSLSLTVVYSLDYARTRLANDAKGKGGERQFNGLVDVYFGLYDSLKPMLLGEDGSAVLSFFLGWAITIVSGLASYPIDTVRRRMMMTSGAAVKYKNSLDCAQQVLKNEGFMSLMKGAGANVLRGVAGAGVLAGSDVVKAAYVNYRVKK